MITERIGQAERSPSGGSKCLESLFCFVLPLWPCLVVSSYVKMPPVCRVALGIRPVNIYTALGTLESPLGMHG